jgi:medium-chain acyl-[acyl-carrier-protein] hydrolase
VCTREDRFVVRIHDCRPDGLVKTSALMQYLQEAAACHAQQLGVGLDNLDQRGCLWVLVDLQMEMTHTPSWGDHLIVTTWPSGCERLIASREFIGSSPDGCEFLRATSAWMILDKHTGRPKNLARLDLDLPQGGPKALVTELSRLQPVEGYARVGTLRVPFSALDFNGHVNNTEYVRWACDAVHEAIDGLPEIRSARLTYLAEVFQGDEIELLVAVGLAGRAYACIRKRSGSAGTNAFLMEMLY